MRDDMSVHERTAQWLHENDPEAYQKLFAKPRQQSVAPDLSEAVPTPRPVWLYAVWLVVGAVAGWFSRGMW